MRSTFAGLNTMVLGLYAQQIGLDTVGHNISNASTDGYSRQIVSLTSTNPQTIVANGKAFEVGTGVTVQSVLRARNIYIDKQMWQETSTLNYAQNNETYLSKIESVFGDPSDTGMQSVLDSFWNSWQTLSTNASDEGTRTTVRERGVELANAVQLGAKQLKAMVADINSVIDLKVDKVNQITSEILSLNKQIVKVEAGGTDHANDLRDKRDYLVDQLSGMIDVRVYEDQSGNYTIQSASTTLVNATGTTKLETRTSADPDYGYQINQIYIPGNNQPLQFTNGEIKSLLDMRDSDQTGAKKYLNDLSAMSKFLLQDFNSVHRAGYGTDNSTNNNFFGDTNTDYTSNATAGYSKSDWINALAVNPALLTADGTAKIAAKLTGGSIGVTQSNASGSAATVFATGSYTQGTTPTSVVVKVTDNASAPPGNITQIQYSLDGGATWNGTDIALDADDHVQVPINGLNVDLYFAANTQNAIGDTYSFSVNEHSADSNFTITQSNANAGTANIVAASGTYTNGDVATNVIVQPYDAASINTAAPIGQINKIKYSIDGGLTWQAATRNTTDGTFKLTGVNGVTLTMQIATDTDNSATDQYYFTVSKGNVASGDNAVLLGECLKQKTSPTLGDKSLDGYYSSLIGTLGVQSENAQRTADNQQALVDQIVNWRESISGVNMDEEMTYMIKFQKGYNAAARVLTTMDEMLDKLINGTGVVGR